mmetsp:Transcript_53578/g.149015  ORF Transcript_53578/g.149015 Transcript_53578/m.149015 type:complete len:211 (+) Transcript_53578:361-993(+)
MLECFVEDEQLSLLPCLALASAEAEGIAARWHHEPEVQRNAQVRGAGVRPEFGAWAQDRELRLPRANFAKAKTPLYFEKQFSSLGAQPPAILRKLLLLTDGLRFDRQLLPSIPGHSHESVRVRLHKLRIRPPVCQEFSPQGRGVALKHLADSIQCWEPLGYLLCVEPWRSPAEDASVRETGHGPFQFVFQMAGRHHGRIHFSGLLRLVLP